MHTEPQTPKMLGSEWETYTYTIGMKMLSVFLIALLVICPISSFIVTLAIKSPTPTNVAPGIRANVPEYNS